MKAIGLLGGMSWESTSLYYQNINRAVQSRLGGLHSARILLYSVDFAEIEAYQASGQWDKSAEALTAAAQSLERAGADFIVICTNTMHKVVPQIQEGIGIPIVHIADATAEVLLTQGISKVGLLGTKYTMTQDFYKSRIENAGITVLIPEPQDISLINQVIYDELCLGIVSEASKREFLRAIIELKERGAQGVILGCTEIGMLISQGDSALPVFDTTQIHAAKAAEYAFDEL